MSDSLRTDRSRALDLAPEADRDAKVEQLLLVGLDYYFAAQYEQAVNVWTRVLFFDRSHARARAYIERARSALAERLRESEELLQTGVEAFQRGEGMEARRLLRAAIDGGAPSDEALAVLERLDRLESAVASTPMVTARAARRLAAPVDAISTSPRRWTVPVVIAVMVAAAGLMVGARRGTFTVASLVPQPQTASMSAPPPRPALALPRRGSTALVRGRRLATAGHLRDALAALDLVRSTDPERAEADRLRADLQRQLLALNDEGDAGRASGEQRVP